MKISRVRIVARGLGNRCPNCGGRTLFKSGTLFGMNDKCPRCGLKFERDDGSFLGSMALNYGATLILFLVPLLLMAYRHAIGATAAIAVAGVGAIGGPMLLYRASRSWWLMNYYFFLPHHLPANREEPLRGEDENS